SSISISGTGWSITSDACTFGVMVPAFHNGCSVGVSVHPAGGGTWNGTLTVHTTAGDRTAHLHAQTPGTPPSMTGFTPSSGPVGGDLRGSAGARGRRLGRVDHSDGARRGAHGSRRGDDARWNSDERSRLHGHPGGRSDADDRELLAERRHPRRPGADHRHGL